MFLSIHYLRGIAALMVAASHAINGRDTLTSMLAGGVDLFFVISGFVIYTATQGKAFDPVDYAWRRFVRIFPLFWAAAAVHLALAAIPGSGMWFPEPGDILGGLMILPTLRPDGTYTPFVPASWTLPLELWFYAIFAVALWLRRWWVAPLILCALVVAGKMDAPKLLSQVYASDLLLEFALGALIAWWVHSGRSLPSLLLPLGIVAFAIMSDVYGFDNRGRGLWRGLPAALIVAGLVAVEIRGRLGASALLFFAGSASYSLYLFHLFAQQTLRAHFEVTAWLPLLAASIAFGALAHLYVERPLLAVCRRPDRRPAT